MRLKKSVLAFALSMAILLGLSNVASACTGVIVGPELTKDGSFIFGRTEDLETNHNKAYAIRKAGTYKKGQTIKDVSYSEDNGYSYTMTKDSYRYTAVKDTTPEYGIFDEAGFNEKGLMVDMTVSAYPNEKINAVDPLLRKSDGKNKIGLTEAILPTVVLSEASTPEEAIKLIATEVATKGSAEGNGLVVASISDLWYMEIYSGHQFLAMRYPRDKFSVFPNTFWINKVTLTEGEKTKNYTVSKDGNYIYSNGLFETAQKAGTFKGDAAKGEIYARESYAPSKVDIRDASRAASGIKVLNPKSNVKIEDAEFAFLQSAPANSISLKMVMDSQRNRFEHMGNLKTNDTGSDGYYPIGNRNVMEAHIFQVPRTATEKFPGIEYLSLGSSLVSSYVPYYMDQTDGYKAAMNESNEYTKDSTYWVAMDILHMVETNRDAFMKVVNEKRDPVQKKILDETPTSKMNAQNHTNWNQQLAKLNHDTLLAIQKELKAALKKDDFTSASERNRSLKLQGSEFMLTVPKNVSDSVLKVKVVKDDKTVSLAVVDAYGNAYKGSVKGMVVTTTKDVLENLKGLQWKGQEIKWTEKDGKSTFALTDQTEKPENKYVVRYSGEDRSEVAVNIWNKFFPKADTVILVNRDASGDAISAANISQGKAPILYTKAQQLTETTEKALAEKKPANVVVLGGTVSVSEKTFKKIQSVLPEAKITRIDGADRYEVNTKTLAELKGSEKIVFTSGQVFSDALMSVPVAKSLKAPVILVKEKQVPAKTAEVLKEFKELKQAVLIGGPKTVAEATKTELTTLSGLTSITRIEAKDRYALGAKVAGMFNKPEKAMVVSGKLASDALTAGPVAQLENWPLLLTKTDLSPAVRQFFKDNDTVKEVIIVGGPKSVSEMAENELEKLLTPTK